MSEPSINVQRSSKIKQHTWKIENPRQSACFTTRDTNTIRHTQVRKTCAMAATILEFEGDYSQFLATLVRWSLF